VASLALSWLILRRRAFVAGAAGRRSGWVPPMRITAVATAVIALLALASNWGPTGVTAGRLSASVATAFRGLTQIQQRELGHPIPAGARYRIVPVCNRRDAKSEGPGDWTCTMNVYVVVAQGTQPLTDTPVSYDVSMQSNGCYKAASPPAYVGQANIRATNGRRVVNPLAVIYGCVNIL
jgi:hypothetical protein